MSASHLALLRGINVGGRNRLPMAQLRTIAGDLGWADVATYVQSGNLVFSARGSAADLAAALRDGIADAAGLDVDVVVLTRAQGVALDADCPWPDVAEPKQVHAYVFPGVLSAGARTAVDDAQGRASEAGSEDEAVMRQHGRVLYLRTPGGFGRSALAGLLDGAAVRRHTGRGTARNLATVRRLREMLDG